MSDIERFVQAIRTMEQQVQDAAGRIRIDEPSISRLEDGMVHEVARSPLEDMTVAGVDGGFVHRSFHGGELLIIRAVAAILSYEKGSLSDHSYIPQRAPQPSYEYETGRAVRDAIEQYTQLRRLDREIGTAQDALSTGLDMLLIDGSIVPQFPDRPGGGQRLRPLYDALVTDYCDLFETAQTQGTAVAGVVEDTTDTRITDRLREQDSGMNVGEYRDSHLLSYVLEAGERTAIMPYGDRGHVVLGDLGSWGEQVYSFHLKTVAHDRPLRIDFVAQDDPIVTGQKIAEKIYGLSAHNGSYGLPTPIIEADRRAKLSPHDIALVTDRIDAKLQHLPGVQGKRRDRRPF